jgi:hypothetical protein
MANRFHRKATRRTQNTAKINYYRLYGRNELITKCNIDKKKLIINVV